VRDGRGTVGIVFQSGDQQVADHDGIDTSADGGTEGRQLDLVQVLARSLDARERKVRVGSGVAMAGKVLGGGHPAAGVHTANEGGNKGGDFVGIFQAMSGLPVTIRLLDPPLHEFLPKTLEELEAIAQDLGVPVQKLQARNKALHEFNPMLGHRGCRLGITYPEIFEMQVQAIMEAACHVVKHKVKPIPEIMIPLIADVNELRVMREMTVRIAEKVLKAHKVRVHYEVGTMIEIARAALLAHEIAPEADFYSFGTNDLTQTTFGLSRDDAGRFLPYYVEKGIFEHDPFITIDRKGVGMLMRMAIANSRKIKKGMKMGICGEQVDPQSVEFCYEIGLTYVSGSPFRLPVARLAAAQATLKRKMKKGLSKASV